MEQQGMSFLFRFTPLVIHAGAELVNAHKFFGSQRLECGFQIARRVICHGNFSPSIIPAAVSLAISGMLFVAVCEIEPMREYCITFVIEWDA